MSTSSSEDLRNERERLEIEKQRLELDRERFAFEQKRSAASTTSSHLPPPSLSLSKKPVPVAMWVLGGTMIVACFLPWISMRSSYDWGIAGRGSLFLGDASGTNFWQGQLCLLLLIGALVAKHVNQRMVAGICALGAPVLAVHFVLQMQGMLGHSQSWSAMGYSGSTSIRADPSFGSIVLVVLSIPYAILAFRQQQLKGSSLIGMAAPMVPQPTVKPVPTIIVNMITVQFCLVLFVLALFFKSTVVMAGVVLFFAALHWVICRKQKWTMASFWSLTLLATAVVNWISLFISSANKPQNPLGRDTGNWLLHVAVEFTDAIATASPYTTATFGLLAIFFAWSEHLNWKPRLGPLSVVVPSWVNPTLASMVVLAYPLTLVAIDATKVDIPSEAERQHAEMIIRGLTTEEWMVFDPTNPVNISTFNISTNNEDHEEPIRFNDYGDALVYTTMLLENGGKFTCMTEFKTSDERWSETLDFSYEGNQILLTPMQNGFLRAQVNRDRWSDKPNSAVKIACPSSTYMRRNNTVRSLEEQLRAHSTFLSPHKQKVDMSSLSDELRNEVRALLYAGKAYTEFPPAIQKRVEEESQGTAIPTNATGSKPVAIAKDVLLAQDTAGIVEYRYESVPPLAWVGLTDSTISLDHQIRFTALSKNNSGEVRILRTYRSVFDTAGVLLTSVERNRVQESVATYFSDSTYITEGIYVSSWCHEECYVQFKVLREGLTEEKELLYLVKDERIPLFLIVDGEGDAEDYTNHEMVGKRFLLTINRTTESSEEEGVGDPLPYWVESLVNIAPM